ncbi:MAG: redoxin family protein [Fimbriimonadaceae bacterium]
MLSGLIGLLAMGQLAMPTKPVVVNAIDIAGVKRPIPDPASKATVVIFVMTDCPIANRMAPEISRICQDYASKSVSVRLAYVDSTATQADVEKHLKAYGHSCPAYLDSKRVLAKNLGASVSPEAIVLDSKGKMQYRGRINDLYESGHGKPKPKATVQDLRAALDEVLAGKKVTNPVVGAIGCYISPP